MLWLYLGTAAKTISTIATGITTVSLYRKWDVFASSVRFIFFFFFLNFFLANAIRSAYFLWLCSMPAEQFVDALGELTPQQMDVLGPHITKRLVVARRPLPKASLMIGDVFLFATSLWMFPMIYELSMIVNYSMDRGILKEKRQMKIYFCMINTLVILFLIVNIVTFGASSRWAIFFVYILQFISFIYMIVVLIMLNMKGRKYESIHGQFIASPIYRRLKRMMVVYAIFSFQFQVCTLVQTFSSYDHDGLLEYIALSSIIYHSTGTALSIITLCSQECVLSFCGCCLPPDAETYMYYENSRGRSSMILPGGLNSFAMTEIIPPPTINPVFVFTDIESSSALWGIGNGEIMQKATEIHDHILRGSLKKYRGYEITTCGDAFQLAFHTIKEAVEYCLDVQMKLLMAEWPKELHGLVDATKKQRAGFKTIFCGIRIRMGIHDANAEDGKLVSYTHPITGKLTYTGASEAIANEVGDLGNGGQILVTKRIVDWLRANDPEVTFAFEIDRIGKYHLSSLDMNVEIFQVNSKKFLKRKQVFTKILDPETGLSLAETSRHLNLSRSIQMHHQQQQQQCGTGETGGGALTPPSALRQSHIQVDIERMEACIEGEFHSMATRISRENTLGMSMLSNFESKLPLSQQHQRLL